MIRVVADILGRNFATSSKGAEAVAAEILNAITLPDFDNANCHRCALPGRPDVVAIYGLRGSEMVARGYLDYADAVKFVAQLAALFPKPAEP